MNNQPPTFNAGSAPTPRSVKRVALYARVSTQEQTKGQYPSCDSQIDELEAFARAKGWEVFESIKDEGHRAGTLKRPGLTRLRWLVSTGQEDVVACAWYNRLIGSRDFYILDKEFKNNNVQFITIHDPADRNTAAGRLFESMLVTIKTFENEQIGEKVRTKMRMRAEKGMWNGGLVPFGFMHDPQTQVLQPNPETKHIVLQMFQTYVDKRSDFAVRDWLKAHQIPAPTGNALWMPGTISELLANRRYIAEIEINRDKQGIDDLPEHESYRIVPAPHEPLVPKELFELAQAIRKEKAVASPGRQSRTRSYSLNQCGRVYPLQGRMVCGTCGHAMCPHYVYHKANPAKGRRSNSYVYHYVCAQKMKYGSQCDHQNRVLAKDAETWILERIEDLDIFDDLLEREMAGAKERFEQDMQPVKESLSLAKAAERANQEKIEEIIESVSSGRAKGALFDILSERAAELKLERERLRAEQRQLNELLAPLEEHFEASGLQSVLSDFTRLAKGAKPEELQRLICLVVRSVEWRPDGKHKVQFYHFPKPQNNCHNPPPGHAAHPLQSWYETTQERAVNRTDTKHQSDSSC